MAGSGRRGAEVEVGIDVVGRRGNKSAGGSSERIVLIWGGRDEGDEGVEDSGCFSKMMLIMAC